MPTAALRPFGKPLMAPANSCRRYHHSKRERAGHIDAYRIYPLCGVHLGDCQQPKWHSDHDLNHRRVLGTLRDPHANCRRCDGRRQADLGPGFDLQMEETVSLSADGRICRSGSRSSTARSPRTSPGSMASHTAQGLSRLPEKPMRRTCSFGFLKAMTPGSLRQAAACREAGCSGSVWRGPFMAIRFS